MENTFNKIEKLLKEAVYYYGLDFVIVGSRNLTTKTYNKIVNDYENNYNNIKLSNEVYTLSYNYVYKLLTDEGYDFSEISYLYERCENKEDYKYLDGFIMFISSKKLVK